MTALDDALNSSSIVWGPHKLTAQWREVQSTESTDNSGDSLVDLSEQRISWNHCRLTHMMMPSTRHSDDELGPW